MDDYTHIAKVYGFKCYFNENTGDVAGTNWFNNKMIELFVWLDVNLTENEQFAFEIIERL